jgi:preprotein translocase subunit SecG
MFTVLLVVQILVSIGIITLVLLQQGKGADMGAGFGAGASGTVFGARGSGSFLTRTTAILAAVFFINCLLIASPLVRHVSRTKSDSVVEQIQQQQAQQKAAEQEKATAAIEKPKGKATEDLPDITPPSAAAPESAEKATEKPAVAASPTPQSTVTKAPESAAVPEKKPNDVPE